MPSFCRRGSWNINADSFLKPGLLNLLAGIMWNTQGCSCRPTKLLPKQKMVPNSSWKTVKNEQITMQQLCRFNSNLLNFCKLIQISKYELKIRLLPHSCILHKICIKIMVSNVKNLYIRSDNIFKATKKCLISTWDIGL